MQKGSPETVCIGCCERVAAASRKGGDRFIGTASRPAPWESMADPLLLFVSPLLFGILLGIVTGMSRAQGSGIALISGVLGTGIVAQLATGLLLALDVNSVLIVLSGFSVGGLLGVFAGIALRRKGIAVEVAQR